MNTGVSGSLKVNLFIPLFIIYMLQRDLEPLTVYYTSGVMTEVRSVSVYNDVTRRIMGEVNKGALGCKFLFDSSVYG